MKEDEFNEIVEQLFNACKDVLQRKNTVYTDGSDRLSNFKRGSELRKISKCKVLWGYLLKHFVAIQNFIDKGETRTGLYLPKIIDTINYLVLLYAMLREEEQKNLK